MSYCRFENTESDLDDCGVALEQLIEGEDHSALSAEELTAAKNLLRRCQEILRLVAEAVSLPEDEIMDEDFDEALDSLNDKQKRQQAEERKTYAADDRADQENQDWHSRNVGAKAGTP
jgi:hypothetical protein